METPASSEAGFSCPMRTMTGPFRGGLVEGAQQHAVVLQHFYDRQQGLRIAELRLAQKRRDAKAVGASAFGLAQAFYDLVDDELHERVAEGLHRAGVHGAAHVAGRVSGEHPVQQVLGTCQLVGGYLVGEGDRAVDHLAVLGHHDDDGLPG